MRRARPRPARRPLGARAGASILEMLIAMTMLSVIMATVLTVLRRQQRFYTAASAVNDTRQQLQQGAAILPIDLRGISSAAANPVGGAATPDILDASPLSDNADTKLSLRVTVGSSIVCDISGSRTELVIPAATALTSSGVKLTSWSTQPMAGDTVYVLDDAASAGNMDDVWQAYEIRSMTQEAANNCPTASTTVGTMVYGPFVTAADAGLNSWRVELGRAGGSTTTATLTTRLGAPVRFVTRVRYALFQAPDTKWYLGYCERTACDGTVTYQALVGPLRPYVAKADPRNGLRFTFFDTTGAVTETPANVSRVDVTLRAITDRAVAFTGGGSTKFVSDTLKISVALRNRR